MKLLQITWDDYKVLTPEEKEEYNFRFKDKEPEFNLTSSLLVIGLLSSKVMVTMVMFYLTITSEQFNGGYLQDNFRSLILYMLMFIFAGFILYFGALLKYLIKGAYFTWKKYKWKKEIGLI